MTLTRKQTETYSITMFLMSSRTALADVPFLGLLGLPAVLISPFLCKHFLLSFTPARGATPGSSSKIGAMFAGMAASIALLVICVTVAQFVSACSGLSLASRQGLPVPCPVPDLFEVLLGLPLTIFLVVLTLRLNCRASESVIAGVAFLFLWPPLLTALAMLGTVEFLPLGA
jgi:hypothetical protein